MKSLFNILRPAAVLGTILVGVGTFAGSMQSPVMAHEAPCPYCKLTLVQDTDEMDNEVVLIYGNKKIEYRCIFCVFADQARYKGDLTVQAPSEKKGAPIMIKRTGDKWSALDSTVFLSSFKRHKTCAAQSRAFTSRAAFDAYVKAAGITDAKPLTLAEELANVAKRAKSDASEQTGEQGENHDEHQDDSSHN